MLTKLLIENLTQSDIKDIEKMISDKISDSEPDMKKLAKDMVENGDVDDHIKDVSIEVIESLFRTLWQRRGSWRGGLR